MKPPRSLLWVLSLIALIAGYALAARALARPDIVPPVGDLAGAFTALVNSAKGAIEKQQLRASLDKATAK